MKEIYKFFEENPTYIVNYTIGNGYNCSCCRNEHDETISFLNKTEMLAWIAQKQNMDIKINEIFQAVEKCRKEYELTQDDKKQIGEKYETAA